MSYTTTRFVVVPRCGLLFLNKLFSDSQVHRPRVIVNFQLSQLISELTDRILMLIAEVIDLIELT